MNALQDYVLRNTGTGAPAPGGTINSIDAHIFSVTKIGGDAETLAYLCRNHRGGVRFAWNLLDLQDGQEYTCRQITHWIDDQNCALRLMALGRLLGMWDMYTPRSVFPHLPEEAVAGMLPDDQVSIRTTARAVDPPPPALKQTREEFEESLREPAPVLGLPPYSELAPELFRGQGGTFGGAGSSGGWDDTPRPATRLADVTPAGAALVATLFADEERVKVPDPEPAQTPDPEPSRDYGGSSSDSSSSSSYSSSDSSSSPDSGSSSSGSFDP